ncbi:DUF3450 family protein [Luteolibacter marinus]|uniref:DUF3450 family protein n=1 Tax=Luteolibacter marinus TaxID=2776705 RepID=UPI0018674794|nr:DUF3450 family protein [Luteolibacter marinus]
MRIHRLLPGVVFATWPLMAQEPAAPANGPSELRKSVREWIETMQEIQKEEDSWEKDREILKGYKEGLETEIETLKEQIERAKTERDSAAKEDLEKIAERDSYAAARESLAKSIAELETGLLASLPLLPETLLKEPKVAQIVEEIKKDSALKGKDAEKAMTRRLNNSLNLLAESEKFQQAVHLREDLLYKTADGREFNMKVLYFGLAAAYAVNESGDVAVVGTPTPSGWVFTERPDLAARITELVGVTTGDMDAKFVSLPIDLP